MPDDQSPQRLTPDELLGDPAGTEPTGPVEKRARDMATGVALVGLGLVAAGLMAILALVLNQLLIFAILAAGVLGDTFYPPLFAWWPVGLAVLLVLFLLLQLVPHTRGDSTSQYIENAGQQDGGDGD